MTAGNLGRDRSASGAELERYLKNVERLLRANDSANALLVAYEACVQGIEHAHLLVLAAHEALRRNERDRALAFAFRARELAPRNADVLNVVGVTLSANRRYREAVRAFDNALQQSPAAYMVRYNKGQALVFANEFARARIELERVLDAQPQHAEALAHLAWLAVQRGDTKPARDYALRALRSDPQQPSAPLSLAAADLADGQYEAVLTRMQPLASDDNPSDTNRSIAQGLIGDAFDALGRTDDAFATYAASQATERARYKAVFDAPGAEAPARLVTRLTDYFRDTPVEPWRLQAGPGPRKFPKTHAFLVGFPRSGTTMLEQVLANHPDIEAMSERNCLDAIQESFTVPPGGIERLGSMSFEDLEPWRSGYWKLVADEGIEPRRKVFIDKMPLYSVFLCLIAKLFPGARILFALRDPRDVVLSCFRRRFEMTPQMYELTSLETAANYYDLVMQLCDLYRRTLALEICDVRYEDMVGNFDEETRRVCTFLGVEWHPGLREFASSAPKRSVATPSGPQLARGLFMQSMGQWRRYATQLAPILPRLEPWVARFGYAPE
jgi:Tfp pilus assembly protein PilF